MGGGIDAPLHLSGTLLPDGVERDVWIVDGRFAFEPRDDARTVASDVFLLPGLVDVHAHLGLNSPARAGASRLERILASGRAQLDAGVLLVREPGGPDRLSAGLGPADGMPRVQSAGHFLSPPGTYIPGLARLVGDAELPSAAEEEARASGFWVKIVGDFPGGDGRFARHYHRDALAEAVARAHAAGARVAIHATLPEVIDDAIEAGVDTIEHGTMLTHQQVGEIAGRGIALVPTLLIREAILGIRVDGRHAGGRRWSAPERHRAPAGARGGGRRSRRHGSGRHGRRDGTPWADPG